MMEFTVHVAGFAGFVVQDMAFRFQVMGRMVQFTGFAVQVTLHASCKQPRSINTSFRVIDW